VVMVSRYELGGEGRGEEENVKNVEGNNTRV
jgi:hypothetical protein